MSHYTSPERGAVGLAIGIVIALAIAGAIAWGSSSRGPSDAMMHEEDSMMHDDAMMQKGGYEEYSPEKLAFADHGKVVLFFHASWCPYCRAIEADILTNRASIPADLLILKADYDRETALKKKYGVNVQYTFVQVDGAGDLITKWTGQSETLADIVRMVK